MSDTYYISALVEWFTTRDWWITLCLLTLIGFLTNLFLVAVDLDHTEFNQTIAFFTFLCGMLTLFIAFLLTLATYL